MLRDILIGAIAMLVPVCLGIFLGFVLVTLIH